MAADLLAPNLLNAKVGLKEFAKLREVESRIRGALERIPKDRELIDADDRDLAALGELFAVLDGLARPRSGVNKVVFSKVVHRKRSSLIPIIDQNVLRLYQATPSKGEARIPVTRGRTWSVFVPLLASEMRDDLRDALPTWDSARRLATPLLSRLRALDIVAWSLGKKPRATTTLRSP